MSHPLSGLRVLELGFSEAAGIAALLLSDFGAEVIRLDMPAKCNEAPELSNEDAIIFGLETVSERLCDRGKKRVLLDLGDKPQRELFLRLLKTSDAVLDGFAPGIMDSYLLSHESLQEAFPDLVYTSVSGYGASGPYADRLWSEATIQAESGFVSTTGTEGGDPFRSGGDMASFFGGLLACIGTLTALLGRRMQGAKATGVSGGRYVDVSMMDSILFGLENQFSLYLKSGVVPKPRGNSYALSAPVGNFPCGDGKEIMISVATEAQWRAFAGALHKDEWLARPEYANVSRRIEHDKLLGEEVSAAFAEYTREELTERLQSGGCIYGYINDFPAVTEHRQSLARGMFIEVTRADGTAFTVPANPLVIDGERMQSLMFHAPGADTETIVSRLRME